MCFHAYLRRDEPDRAAGAATGRRPAGLGSHLDGKGGRLGGQAEILRTETDLVEDRRRDDLRVRVLEDHGDVAGQPRNRRGAGVGAADLDGTVQVGADHVRDQAVDRQGERGLAAAGRAEQQHHLAGADVGRHVARPGHAVVAGTGLVVDLVPDGDAGEPQQHALRIGIPHLSFSRP